MTYRGKVKDGVIVLDDGNHLPEGMDVQVQPLPPGIPALRQTLLKYAGVAKGLPRDAARNHDHYLYGTPKQ